MYSGFCLNSMTVYINILCGYYMYSTYLYEIFIPIYNDAAAQIKYVEHDKHIEVTLSVQSLQV